MVLPWFIAVLVALVVAFKFVALGALVVACIVVWALFRLLFRTVRAVSGRPSSHHRPSDFAYAAVPPRPGCRYDEARPVVQTVTPAAPPRMATPPRRSRFSALAFWVVVGLGVAFLFAHVRSRRQASELLSATRTHVDAEYRYTSGGSEQPRVVQAAEKSKKRAAKSTPAPKAPVPLKAEPISLESETSWMLIGRGETVDDAKDDACIKAHEELLVYLRNQDPPVEWYPPKDFVRKHLARRWGSVTHMELDGVPGGVVEIPLYVELNPTNREKIAGEVRHSRVEARMNWLGKIFAGLIVLLTGIAGYVRLDEWSKGYYTGVLRVAAVAVLVASAAGMWMLVRSQ